MMSGGGLDYVIISYVLIYCTDDPTADMLARLLTVDRVKAVLISERNQENEMIARMKMRQINVSKLMGQQGERDDRQMVRTRQSYQARALSLFLSPSLPPSLALINCPRARSNALQCRCFYHRIGRYQSRRKRSQAHFPMSRASFPHSICLGNACTAWVWLTSSGAVTRNTNADPSEESNGARPSRYTQAPRR